MSPRRTKILIELYGLPGGGKSTLAREIALKYGFSHITATSVSRFEYITLFLYYTRVVIFWLLLILKNFLQVKSIRHFRYNISLLFVSLKKIHLAYTSKEERVILDEGLIQRFLSYSDIVISEREITRLISLSPLGTIVILINDREVIKDRFDEKHDRGSIGPQRLDKWRKNMSENITKISAILVSTKKVTFFETKNSSPSDILQKLKNSFV